MASSFIISFAPLAADSLLSTTSHYLRSQGHFLRLPITVINELICTMKPMMQLYRWILRSLMGHRRGTPLIFRIIVIFFSHDVEYQQGSICNTSNASITDIINGYINFINLFWSELRVCQINYSLRFTHTTSIIELIIIYKVSRQFNLTHFDFFIILGGY